MPGYIIKRLALWIPSVLLLCLVGFLLLRLIPGDPVLARMKATGVPSTHTTSIYYTPEYLNFQRESGIGLPVFYFSVQPASVPDSVYRIPHPQHRQTAKQMCLRFAENKAVLKWYNLNLALQQYYLSQDQSELARAVQSAMTSTEPDFQFHTHQWLLKNSPDEKSQKLAFAALAEHNRFTNSGKSLSSYFPKFNWNGKNSQFHHWFFGNEKHGGIIAGHFGFSLRNGQPVSQMIGPALKTTLSLALVSVMLIYLVSLPLGLRISRIENPNVTGFIVKIIFALYAMPGFWLGVLMLVFLCSPDFLNWFPVAYSLMDIHPDSSFLHRTWMTAYHLVLPVTCWSLSGMAFVSLQTMHRSRSLRFAPFVVAARSKGLSEKQLVQRHVAKNAALPAISMLGGIIPAAFSGSIAIELIFSIPGMGQMIFTAFHARDYPVIMAILIIIGSLAMLATSVSDIIQYRSDPRLHQNAEHAV